MIVDVRQAIQEYKREHGLKGPVNKNNVVLSNRKVEWSSLQKEDDDDYSSVENEECDFSTKIGTEVEITSGRLIGLPKFLPLSLDGLQQFVIDLIKKPIVIELKKEKDANMDDITFTEDEIDLFKVYSATFKCQVKLKGDVIFKTSTCFGVYQSCLEVPISDIIGKTSWTVEGKCTFHLRLNDRQ
ncbi:unnamed protein product [Lymnaea stagnalis]|uniref:Uncharacterized protein n=1 Tax=Lymnaea stagnalis TaxID=6523 RepID=A0AAV2HUJ8_LYMST